eukprot:jgi/Mesvir1/12950/Mv05964-RA.1
MQGISGLGGAGLPARGKPKKNYSPLPTRTENHPIVSQEPIPHLAPPKPAIDVSASRFPHCIVWTPLPLIAWFVPFVGHIGICTSAGVILDFAGPYYVSYDNFAFGKPYRIVKLLPDMGNGGNTDNWDKTLQMCARSFQHQTYNILTANCHSFVAHCLNEMDYAGKRGYWNVVTVLLLILRQGEFVNVRRVLGATLPCAIITSIGVFLVGWTFLFVNLSFFLFFAVWFIMGTYVFKGCIRS